MYNVEDILARLQNGESADAIAQSFTDALNNAIQKKKEEDAIKTAYNEKVERLTTVIDEVLSFVEDFYPEFIPEDADIEITTEEIEGIIAAFDTYMPKYAALTQSMAELEKLCSKPSRATSKTNVKIATNNDAITSFLRSNGLL